MALHYLGPGPEETNMLFRQATLARIQAGKITLAFRRWKRPTVRTGGSLLTAIGVLSIASVEPVELDAVTERDAIAAGFAGLEALHLELATRTGGVVYRIELSLSGPDPRIALREKIPEAPEELEVLKGRLDRWDAASTAGAWTAATLRLVATQPAVRAPDLATELGMQRDPFKRNVRKLKSLGLTESLEIGYRLSPRGRVLLAWLDEIADNEGA